MLNSTDPTILLLKQEDVVKAGLKDMKMIMATTEETYTMYGKGELINPKKPVVRCPNEENWNSFFVAMPCYVGGDINIAGFKWAAESKKNIITPNMPTGIDITVLSDPETVLPFCFLDATLITAMRTSAVAGTFAKYTAPSHTKEATAIGAGVIGRTMIMALAEALPELEKLYLCDLDITKAEGLKEEFKGVYDFEIIPTTDSKKASMDTKLVVTATTARKPFVDESWIRPGTTLINMGPTEVTSEAVLKADKIYVDTWLQVGNMSNLPVGFLASQGKVKQEEVVELCQLMLDKSLGRKDDGQAIFCESIGFGSLDIMIAYKLYKKAVELGLGQNFKLWDNPLWV